MTNDFYLVLPSDSCKAINPKNKSDKKSIKFTWKMGSCIDRVFV